MSSQKNNYKVPNLERGMQIMELLSRNTKGMTMVEIAAELGYPNNSVFRISTTLVDLGYLKKSAIEKKFTLTKKVFELGYSCIDDKNIVEESLGVMRELRDIVEETVCLGCIIEEKATGMVMAQVDSVHPFSFRVNAGANFPLHCSAPAKSIIAFLPEKEQLELINRINFIKYNENTITNKKEFLKEMAKVKACNYAVDRSEQAEGCHCVSSTIFNSHNYPIASIWMTGPSFRVKEKDFSKIADILIDHSNKITENLK